MITLQEFITENQEELDRCIRNVHPTANLDDEERELWVNNDEGLYQWAESAGVDFEEG